MKQAITFPRTILNLMIWFALGANAFGQDTSLEDIKAAGASVSHYRTLSGDAKQNETPAPNLSEYRRHIEPLMRAACAHCHGPNQQEGDFRVDTLDPNLSDGEDKAWWLEVFDAVGNGEMPPEGEAELSAKDRSRIIEWLSAELRVAAELARIEQGHSSFRRLTRYEYNYALQDLLGLPYDFASDLPPEAESEDGFLNSSEMLQMSAMQFETYREIAQQALTKATVRGEQPRPVFYSITMDSELEKAADRLEADLDKIRKRFADQPERLNREVAKRKTKTPGGAHYRSSNGGAAVAAKWSYRGARYARTPTSTKPVTPEVLGNTVVIPRGQKWTLDLGDHLPDSGTLLMRVRAAVLDHRDVGAASLRVYFGHQASNNSKADERVGQDIVLKAASHPTFFDIHIPLSEVVRNPFRGIQDLGQTPNPAEYVILQNTSSSSVDIQIDYIEITAPFFESWPTKTHRRIFPERAVSEDEATYARRVLADVMSRAWRRAPTKKELDKKVALVQMLRPQCQDTEEAIVEVLAVILSAPQFLYLANTDQSRDDCELATRLSMLLWSSLPDQELLDLAIDGQLGYAETLTQQVERMLADQRSHRFAKHFVSQWLGLGQLKHLQADNDLREAMAGEPVAFFEELLRENHSVMDFLHADYAVVNARLAQHYGLPEVAGNEFRRVSLPLQSQRGGLLTQAGLLAMNSDGKDSHPLKRGIWLLENILNDPPPPPPPSVPEIDLSDPEILELTLQERMEDHRSDPACLSCHQRIDPWGIAFENFDAVGRWRDTIRGESVDATSTLINGQQLRGIDGLKRYLLAKRQDQFARALTHKLCAYAMGRPLSFGDRSEVDQITAKLRREGDGLRTLVKLIVTSDLFVTGN